MSGVRLRFRVRVRAGDDLYWGTSAEAMIQRRELATCGRLQNLSHEVARESRCGDQIEPPVGKYHVSTGGQ